MKNALTLLGCLTLLACYSCKTGRMTSLYDTKKDTIQLPEISVNATKSSYQGSKTKLFDLLHSELHIRPDFRKRSVEGMAILMVKPHAYSQDTLILDAKGFDIHEIYKYNSADKRDKLTYSYNRNILKIRLNNTYYTKDVFRIQIKYTAYPHARLDSGLIKGRDRLGLTFINADGKDSLIPTQLWSQGETEYNSAWFPTIEATNQKMRQDLFLTLDSSYTALSNGKFMGFTPNKDGSRTWYWKMDKPHAPYLTMIAAGNWKVVKDMWRNKMPVNYYVEPAYAPYAKMIFGNTPEMIEYFSTVLGYDYPWQSFSQIVVREYTSGAMENTTAVVHFDALQHDRKAHIDNTYEDIISHELFHQWFGDLITCESWDYLSMNESFATFGEFLWKEHKYGADEAGLKRQEALNSYLREASYNKENIINHYYKDPEELFDRHRYEKGGLVLYMLKVVLGDSVFFKGLNEYIKERAFKTTNLEYFRLKMEEVSGQDLHWFFNQWFESPGHPELKITHSYNRNTKTISVFSQQIQSEGIFRLPVDIDFYNGISKTTKHIILSHKKDTFTFKMNEEPSLVNFDAQKYLLCRSIEGKNIHEWLNQFFYAPLFRDKYDALQALAEEQQKINKDTLQYLMRTALSSPFWYLRKTVIELFFNKPNNYQGEFREKIHSLALKDPKSKVRALALYTVEVLEKEQGFDLYNQSLSDSSYFVVGTALNAIINSLTKNDSIQKLEAVKHFENSISPEIILTVTNVYSQYGGLDKLPLFHKLPYTLSGHHLNTIINDYRKFLLRTNTGIVKNEIPFIFSIDRKIRNFWEAITYKTLLMDLANAIKDGKLMNSGLSEDELDKLSEKLHTKADQLDLKKFRS